MKVLGIAPEKNGFRYCVLSGNRDNPHIIHYEKIQSNNFTCIQQLMNWYETSFENLISKFTPSCIGIKVSLAAKKDQIAHWYYPFGILHNSAHQKNTKTFEFVSANFTASKFGMDKTIESLPENRR